jgi:hypothetical protein
MVAKPQVMIWWISALVIWGTKGLTNIADSPCPMKGVAAATMASAPDTPSAQKTKPASLRTNHWMKPM